jgi:hypothetical protein
MTRCGCGDDDGCKHEAQCTRRRRGSGKGRTGAEVRSGRCWARRTHQPTVCTGRQPLRLPSGRLRDGGPPGAPTAALAVCVCPCLQLCPLLAAPAQLTAAPRVRSRGQQQSLLAVRPGVPCSAMHHRLHLAFATFLVFSGATHGPGFLTVQEHDQAMHQGRTDALLHCMLWFCHSQGPLWAHNVCMAPTRTGRVGFPSGSRWCRGAPPDSNCANCAAAAQRTALGQRRSVGPGARAHLARGGLSTSPCACADARGQRLTCGAEQICAGRDGSSRDQSAAARDQRGARRAHKGARRAASRGCGGFFKPFSLKGEGGRAVFVQTAMWALDNLRTGGRPALQTRRKPRGQRGSWRGRRRRRLCSGGAVGCLPLLSSAGTGAGRAAANEQSMFPKRPRNGGPKHFRYRAAAGVAPAGQGMRSVTRHQHTPTSVVAAALLQSP